MKKTEGVDGCKKEINIQEEVGRSKRSAALAFAKTEQVSQELNEISILQICFVRDATQTRELVKGLKRVEGRKVMLEKASS
jgi:hypothetical protein